LTSSSNRVYHNLIISIERFIMKTSIFLSVLLSLFFLAVSPVKAASSDGSGPWADSVVSTHQALEKNGNSVPSDRSDPNEALGVAEKTGAAGTFYSLGFGGSIVLGFDNGISGSVEVDEVTLSGYPMAEKARIEMSADGTNWVNVGTLTSTGTVNNPNGISCARYLKITDVSNPNDFADATADGYDVDGVRSTGGACTGSASSSTSSPAVAGVCTSTKPVVEITQTKRVSPSCSS
jgi:hypothetical protein